jgi:hypothetical protein
MYESWKSRRGHFKPYIGKKRFTSFSIMTVLGKHRLPAANHARSQYEAFTPSLVGNFSQRAFKMGALGGPYLRANNNLRSFLERPKKYPPS